MCFPRTIRLFCFKFSYLFHIISLISSDIKTHTHSHIPGYDIFSLFRVRGSLILLLADFSQKWPRTVVISERRRGAYLVCPRVSCVGKGHDCCLVSQSSGECSHPPIQKNWLIRMRPSTDRAYSHCPMWICQWNETITARLIKMAIWVWPEVLFLLVLANYLISTPVSGNQMWE